MQTVHLTISGKVQGVFYRASAKEEADRLRLQGWVRNTATGAVEALVQGPAEAVNRFIAWCRQGPPRAKVREVRVEPAEAVSFPGFTVLR